MRSLDTPTRLSFDLGLANVCVRVLAYMHIATYVRIHLQVCKDACMHACAGSARANTQAQHTRSLGRVRREVGIAGGLARGRALRSGLIQARLNFLENRLRELAKLPMPPPVSACEPK